MVGCVSGLIVKMGSDTACYRVMIAQPHMDRVLDFMPFTRSR